MEIKGKYSSMCSTHEEREKKVINKIKRFGAMTIELDT
jgi:hypothetical protein